MSASASALVPHPHTIAVWGACHMQCGASRAIVEAPERNSAVLEGGTVLCMHMPEHHSCPHAHLLCQTNATTHEIGANSPAVRGCCRGTSRVLDSRQGKPTSLYRPPRCNHCLDAHKMLIPVIIALLHNGMTAYKFGWTGNSRNIWSIWCRYRPRTRHQYKTHAYMPILCARACMHTHLCVFAILKAANAWRAKLFAVLKLLQRWGRAEPHQPDAPLDITDIQQRQVPWPNTQRVHLLVCDRR